MRRKTDTSGVIRVHSRTARLILVTATATIVGLGGLASFFSYMSIVKNEMEDFTAKSESAQASFVDGLNEYNNLLYVGRGFLQTRSSANTKEWNDFFHSQGVFEKYAGVEAISYVKVVNSLEAPKTLQAIRSGLQNPDLNILPSGMRDQYALSALISSENVGEISSINDAYADPTQKQVFDLASRTQQPTASPPLTLASGQRGLFITLPNYLSNALDGFIVLTLHSHDLIPNLINADESLTYEVRDVDGETSNTVYLSPGWSYNNALSSKSYNSVGSRTWQIEIAQISSLQSTAYYILPLSIFLATVIIALFMVAAVHRIATTRRKNQIL